MIAAPVGSPVPGLAPSGPPAATGWRLRVHESLPSTSGLLVALAEAGEPEGLAVLARRQTAGRGRQGRVWDSQPGNLHASVLLRPALPPRFLPQWSLLAAVALAEALESFLPPGTRDRLRLRWPNDLLLDGAKCAGILVDAGIAASVDAWVVIGFGANLARAPEVPGRAVACLADAGVAAPPVEAAGWALLAALDRWRRVRLLEGFGPVRKAWMARGPERGTPLTVRGAGGPIGGRYEGLAEDGALLLATGGRVHAVAAGELAG